MLRKQIWLLLTIVFITHSVASFFLCCGDPLLKTREMQNYHPASRHTGPKYLKKDVDLNTSVSARGRTMLQATLCPCLYFKDKASNFSNAVPICWCVSYLEHTPSAHSQLYCSQPEPEYQCCKFSCSFLY